MHKQRMSEKAIMVPKSNGRLRKIELPSDEIKNKQWIILKHLEPSIDKDFTYFNYGFRKRKGTKAALDEFKNNVNNGFHWIASIDIKKCFSNINPTSALNLIDTRLEWIPGINYKKKLPQGHPISPILSNVYLNQFDQTVKHWSTPYKQSNIKSECRIIRYADNIWLMCKKKTELEIHLNLAIKKLSELGFKVRSRIRHVNQGINFLGFTITRWSIRPNYKNIQRYKQRIIEYALKLFRLHKKLNNASLREDDKNIEKINSRIKKHLVKFNRFTSSWNKYFNYSIKTWLVNLLYKLQLIDYLKSLTSIITTSS